MSDRTNAIFIIAALALAGCENERTVVADPAVVNEAADQAAEMGRPSYTPIEVGNGIGTNETVAENSLAESGNVATE